MDVLTLLAEALAAGLKVRADGDRLVVTGPRSAAHIARRLGEAKPAVLAVIRAASCCQSPQPVSRPTLGGDKLFCSSCGRRIGADAPYPWSNRL